MPEEIKQEAQIAQPEKKEEDLVTRVSQVKPEEKTDTTFNLNDIEKIADPQAKEYAQRAYKSLESGYQKKFQAVADIRKELEAKKTDSDKWTPEKVQELTKDPNFVQAAQNVASQQDDYSTLTDTEKKKVSDAESQAKLALQQATQMYKQQQYGDLQRKYVNFKPETMDAITSETLRLKGSNITYENMWKAYDYEPGIKRAYELGLKDKVTINQEKLTSMSTEGTTVTGDDSIPPIEKGESDMNYFRRLANRRLSQKAETGQIRK